jgi:regulator of RNase E activity RraA
VAALTFVDWQEPIGCGGVAVNPNDVVVVDGDGAVLIPRAFIDDVVNAAPDPWKRGSWARS